MTTPPPHLAWALWGKASPSPKHRPSPSTSPPSPDTHPLLCHLADVASVALAMLRHTLPRGTVHQLIHPLQLPEEHAHAWLAFFIALHDLGKATPAFQAKYPPQVQIQKSLGLPFSSHLSFTLHGTLGIAEMARILSSTFQLPKDTATRVARAVCAHHGTYPTSQESNPRPLALDLGNAPWKQVREQIVELVAQWLDLANRPPPSLACAQDHAWIILLSGLTSIADWIGSMQDVFVYTHPPDSLETYAPIAEQRALSALHEIHWNARSPAHAPRTFGELFPSLGTPWNIHTQAQSLIPRLTGPSLIIIEAPMGEGKTEAALLLADALAAQTGHDGFYIGLPTQATSNAMIGRAKDFLMDAYPDRRKNLHLIHGDAALQKEYKRLRSIGADENKRLPNEVAAEEWFCSRKRALLSTYAVGTADQALLSVMPVRHGFVRLFGLSGKTVVLDEIHAYDIYTSTLIERLLEWLSALGTSVILLSATLPSHRRKALLRAYGAEANAVLETPYPRITAVCGAEMHTRPILARRPPFSVDLEGLNSENPRITAERLVSALKEEGGCAGWICNTVARAQEAYQAVRECLSAEKDTVEIELHLIHARMFLGERQRREEALGIAFGRGEDQRPKRAVLVGTQVLEQSLDLDFDVLVSDFAPIDLLFQRAGRLHRHERKAKRPKAFKNPRLWIVQPGGCNRPEGPFFSTVAPVYEEEVLLTTWLCLQHRDKIHLPTDIEPMIEWVYRDVIPPEEQSAWPSALVQRLQERKSKSESKAHEHQSAAQIRLLPSPRNAGDIFCNLSMHLQEDENSEAVHKSLQALTRRGDPSVELIGLFGSEQHPTLDAEGHHGVNLTRPPTYAEALALLQNSLRLSHKTLVPELFEQPIPKSFEQSPLLCRKRIVFLGPSPLSLSSHTLRLDSELGLVIESRSKDRS